LASASVAGDKIVVSYSDAGDHSISLSEGEAVSDSQINPICIYVNV